MKGETIMQSFIMQTESRQLVKSLELAHAKVFALRRALEAAPPPSKVSTKKTYRRWFETRRAYTLEETR
jgi:hypothetical protein